MTKRQRTEKELIESIEQMDENEVRVMRLVMDAIMAGGEARERIARGTAWFNSPEGEEFSHADTLKAMEAIATGNLGILPDYLVNSIREVVFTRQEGATA